MKNLLCFVGLGAAVAATAAHATGMPVLFAGYAPGTVVVKTHARELYYVVSAGEALRYRVAVGRDGMRWSGASYIDGMYKNPPWQAPWGKNHTVIPGGSPHNPMGVAALTLHGHDERYAIHGTNEPQKIGQFVSHGCIRMYNVDVLELYDKVHKGTPVIVLP